jgi:voltage-gated potassium channel
MKASTKEKLYHIVFQNDTKAGKQFDIWLLWLILISVLVAMLDSVPSLNGSFSLEFYLIEWVFTLLFTIEYIIRVSVHPQRSKYVFSFWGLVDLLAILPAYLSLLFVGSQYFIIVRVFRLLRVFRILRLVQFNREAYVLINALRASTFKISIFLSTVITIVVLLGTIMYVVESPENGFTSIPQSIYWAVITITTVGYGDVVPVTVLGKFISSFAMIIGYAIIAVPTGIVTVEMTKSSQQKKACPTCDFKNNPQANYCNNCGSKLELNV